MSTFGSSGSKKIEEAHNNKVAYNNHPKWDSKNCAFNADLIEQHLSDPNIYGTPCAYHIQENPTPAAELPISLGVDLFDGQIIKQLPIIKNIKLLSDLKYPN